MKNDHFVVQFVRLAFEPVGLAGYIDVMGGDVQAALGNAWAAFNRGSGREIAFEGPSASVGDLFVVTINQDKRRRENWQVMPVGFRQWEAI